MFRFFNGVNGFNRLHDINHQNSIRYPNRRIQNTPNSEVLNNLLNNNYQFNNNIQSIRGTRQYSPIWSFPSKEENNYYENTNEKDTLFPFKTVKSLKFPEDYYLNNNFPTSTNLPSLPFYFPDSFFVRGAELNVEKDHDRNPIGEVNNFVFKDGK